MKSTTVSTSIKLHLAATITAAVAFQAACSYSSGWFMPLLCYLLAMISLFTLIHRFGPLSKAQKIGLWAVQLVATPAFVAALWFSGKLNSIF
ncbi:MAG: hypothetical protein KJ556_08010 [Gammaproteobacteria bacterium]|nr:hypothetical protein [Gammaproteobacteria bacterium]MBU2058957.1 hypothetical protein [Gammaproteobacteria bacterium]MBU2175054.1 hypothetical protein [Gammaproteobacteria bacterium]MBU2246737.1 hypothetical protein [Gammaproteobacteria bacterium]MBU2345923.1 hypothetical protein [Gammaproteobacteria bacterium]